MKHTVRLQVTHVTETQLIVEAASRDEAKRRAVLDFEKVEGVHQAVVLEVGPPPDTLFEMREVVRGAWGRLELQISKTDDAVREFDELVARYQQMTNERRARRGKSDLDFLNVRLFGKGSDEPNLTETTREIWRSSAARFKATRI